MNKGKTENSSDGVDDNDGERNDDEPLWITLDKGNKAEDNKHTLSVFSASLVNNLNKKKQNKFLGKEDKEV
jgi:hypothetical protein